MAANLPEGRPDLFVSAKTAEPVPVRHPALRTALVAATLDPPVRSISYLATAAVASRRVALDAVVLERGDGRCRLDVVPARPARSFDEEGLVQIALRDLGLATLVVTAEDLRAEPMASNRDIVWSYRGRTVPLDLKMQILRILADDGPMTLDRLLAGVVSGRDPAAAVMSLCCEGLLELDLATGPVGPATLARSRG